MENKQWIEEYPKKKANNHFGNVFAGFCDICMVHPCKCTEQDIENWRKYINNKYNEMKNGKSNKDNQ